MAMLYLESTSLCKFKLFLLSYINVYFSAAILICFHCPATMYYLSFWSSS